MGVFTGTIPTFTVERARASKLQTMADALTALTTSWTPWVPTLTNFAAGSTAVIARYRHLADGSIDWYFRWIWSAGASVSTNPTISLPAAPAAHYPTSEAFGTFPGIVHLVDAATAAREGNLERSGTDTVQFAFWNATPSLAQITSTAPWTWTTNDSITAYGNYEPA